MKHCFASFVAIALLYTAIMACQTTDISLPDFDVTTAKTTYKAGEPVSFTFAGSNPDQLVFYSGELGKRYANRDRVSGTGVTKLVFQVAMQQGALPGLDSLRLLASTNLKTYDAAGVTGATWADITSRNARFPKTLGTAFSISDSVNVSDFNTADSVAFAFRVVNKKNATLAQRKWQVQNVILTNVMADGTPTPLLSTFANTGWTQVSVKNPTNAWDVGTARVSAATSLSNTSGVLIRSAYPISFDPTTAVNVDDNDDWLITTKVNLKTVKPDVGAVVKNAGGNTLPVYTYVFRTAGAYTVTFIAQNVSLTDRKDTMKQVQITVTP